MAYNPNEPRDKDGRWGSGGAGSSRLKRAAKVAGGVALTGAVIVGGAIAGGAARSVAKDHIKREVLKTVAGKTLAKHAGRMLNIPPSHADSARQGAMAVTAKMSSHVSRHAATLKSHLKSQHRIGSTGPKIRNKKGS